MNDRHARTNTPLPSRRPRAAAAATLVAACVAAAVGAGSYLLGGVAASEPAAEAEPLSVRTLTVERVEHYTVSRSYVGALAPRRTSAIGFELSGRLRSLAADDGQVVAAGDPLASLDTRRLEARRAELTASRREAEARADLADTIYRRTREAFDADAATQRELDTAREERRAAQAAVAAVSRRIESIDVDLGKSELAAPFDAVIASRHLDEGEVIDAGTPVLTLLERAEPEARIGVPPRLAEALTPGRRLEVVVQGRTMRGELRRKLPVTARGTRTVEIVVAIDADFAGLREGDLARVALPRRIEEGGFWLPLSALTESSRGLWACYVAEPLDGGEGNRSGPATHRLTRRPIQVVHSDERRALVRGTLAAGEAVVADGLHRVVAGQAVRLAEGGRR